jgi:hypothetical protein
VDARKQVFRAHRLLRVAEVVEVRRVLAHRPPYVDDGE